MNIYKSMILMDPKNYYYSFQETPMDLPVIGYSSGSFVRSIIKLNMW